MAFLARLLLFPFLVFSRALALLPPRALQGLGAALGHLLRWGRFRHSIVQGNLELALGGELGPRELARIKRGAYRNAGTVFLEIMRNFTMPAAQKKRELLVSRSAMEQIAQTLAPGRGAIIVSGHIANWELFAMGMSAWGVPVSIVVKKMNNPLSQYLLERQRKLNNIELIYAGTGAIEKLKDHLARGRAIGFMVDQNTTGKRGIRANFFGVPASATRSLAKLVRETGVPVVPICAFRLPSGKQEVKTLPPLPFLEAPHLPAGSPERLAREEWLNTQQYQTAVETLVRLHPEQWLWIHRRWKANRAPLVAGAEHLENMNPG